MKKMTRLAGIVVCLFLHLLQTELHSQAIDLTFNPVDVGFGLSDGANGTVNTVAVQSDGKILIGGEFTGYNGTGKNRVARLHKGSNESRLNRCVDLFHETNSYSGSGV